VIDDQPAIQDLLSWALKLHGYEPVCVANGREALAWTEEALCTRLYPAAILLDLLMQIMDGAGFLVCLRARWDASVPILPVILLTVDKSSHDDLACSQVFIKPFHIRDLYAHLKTLALSSHIRSRHPVAT
jgi:two-component system, OmpR family, phosphate regulon response regulator PhoB